MTFEIKYSLTKNQIFMSKMQSYLRPWAHVLILVGVMWAVFFLIFGIDVGMNGWHATMSKLWKLQASLMYLSIIITAASGLYFVATPIVSYLQACSALKKKGAELETVISLSKSTLSVIAGGETTTYNLADLRLWHKTKQFVYFRDRTKKGHVSIMRQVGETVDIATKGENLTITADNEVLDKMGGMSGKVNSVVANSKVAHTQNGISDEQLEMLTKRAHELYLDVNPVARERERQKKIQLEKQRYEHLSQKDENASENVGRTKDSDDEDVK